MTATSLCCLVSCATPVQKLNEVAGQHGFERGHLIAKGFQLTVFEKPAVVNENSKAQNNSKPLHIYLEGDGSPWRYRIIVMPDPTPRSPLMLDLMKLDSANAVYLGRPCYNGQAQDDICSSAYWTSGRYSRPVVDSMAAGIRVLMHKYKTDTVRLFGHSGGGTLALLVAESVAGVSHIVTLAGNLDTEAWIQHHGYTPLYSSVNPAKQPGLPANIQQWHLVGGRDTVIPPQLVKPFILNQSSASGVQIDGYNHGCCWSRIWPNVLDAIETGKPLFIPGSQYFKHPVEPIAGQDNR